MPAEEKRSDGLIRGKQGGSYIERRKSPKTHAPTAPDRSVLPVACTRGGGRRPSPSWFVAGRFLLRSTSPSSSDGALAFSFAFLFPESGARHPFLRRAATFFFFAPTGSRREAARRRAPLSDVARLDHGRTVQWRHGSVRRAGCWTRSPLRSAQPALERNVNNAALMTSTTPVHGDATRSPRVTERMMRQPAINSAWRSRDQKIRSGSVLPDLHRSAFSSAALQSYRLRRAISQQVAKFPLIEPQRLAMGLTAIACLVPGGAWLRDLAVYINTRQLSRGWPRRALRAAWMPKCVLQHLHHVIATLGRRFRLPPLQSNYLRPQARSGILLLQRPATAWYIRFRPTDCLLQGRIANRSHLVPTKSWRQCNASSTAKTSSTVGLTAMQTDPSKRKWPSCHRDSSTAGARGGRLAGASHCRYKSTFFEDMGPLIHQMPSSSVSTVEYPYKVFDAEGEVVDILNGGPDLRGLVLGDVETKRPRLNGAGAIF
ncbi:hypothetical protein MTO96_024470 [Rhipicephalus appendiculatus]